MSGQDYHWSGQSFGSPSFWLPWVPEVFSRVRQRASFRRPQTKAEDTSGETTHFLRLDRKRKPRMKSLWHPGYILTGYVNNHSHYYVSREQVSFFTSCFCLLIRIVVSELKFFWPVTKLGNRPKFILSSGFTLFWNGMWNDDFKFLLRYLLCPF